MWVTFLAAVLFVCVLLYLPGFFLLLHFKFECKKAIACAPSVSLLIFVSIILLTSLLNIPGWLIPLLGMMLVCIVFLGLFICSCKKTEGSQSCSFFSRRITKEDLSFILTAFVSVIIVTFVYVLSLDSPISIYQENDCIAHLDAIRDLYNSGLYFNYDAGIYPQGWRSLVAFVMAALNINIGIAANAVNFVLLSLVFPLGIHELMRQMFNFDTSLFFTPITSLAFSAYPWGFLVFGPLYPNLIGYAMLPQAMLFFSLFIIEGQRYFSYRYCILWLLSTGLLVILHPSAIFAAIVLLTPYCIYALLHFNYSFLKTKSARRSASVLFLLLVIAGWVFLNRSASFSEVVTFPWEPYTGISQAIVNVATLSLTKTSSTQLFLALMVFLGLFEVLFTRKHFWALFSFLASSLIYVVCIGTSFSFRELLSGFWYNDSFRVAANVALSAIPLATIGLHLFYRTILKIADKMGVGLSTSYKQTCSFFFVFLISLSFVFWPNFQMQKNFSINTAFGSIENMLFSGNSLEENVNPLDIDEISFGQQVHDLIGSEELILNIPFDGSGYLRDYANLSMCYQGWYAHYAVPSVDDPMTVLRLSLNEGVENQRVLQALKELQVHYLLLLDKDSNSDGYYYLYDDSNWSGFINCSPSTPGLIPILSQDDMILYKINY